MYLVLLYTKHSILKIPKKQRNDAQKKEVAHLGFIAGSYKPEYWYGYTLSHSLARTTTLALASFDASHAFRYLGAPLIATLPRTH